MEIFRNVAAPHWAADHAQNRYPRPDWVSLIELQIQFTVLELKAMNLHATRLVMITLPNHVSLVTIFFILYYFFLHTERLSFSVLSVQSLL